MEGMKFIKGPLKVIAAGIVSIIILCALLCFYSITPVHEDNPRGNTDYVWPSNSMWVKLTEGIAFGRFDADGYNNKKVIDDPDIIVLGSSHFEATEVMQNENAPYLLAQKLNGRYTVYNMAISGHDFYRVCGYIQSNLELYDTIPKVLIIETFTVKLSPERVDAALSSSVDRQSSYSKGIIGLLQRIPFFRSVYHQMEEGLLQLFVPGLNKAVADDPEAIETEKEKEISVDKATYEKLFSYFKDLEEKYGTQIIIIYHPTEELMADGSVYFNRNVYPRVFKQCADKYEISFIDMTDRFERMYYEDHHVAHGFCTGKLAYGHLNKYGHAVMAEELYNEIINLEEGGELCK